MLNNSRLLQVAAKVSVKALIEQVPVLGKLMTSLVTDLERQAFEQQVLALLAEIARGGTGRIEGKARRVTRIDPTVLVPFLQRDAALADRLATPSRADRAAFLYLASGKYASEARTYEIAIQHHFLWRSFHNKTGQSISNASKIRAGDVIVLGYRSPCTFRVSLPLVVKSSGPFTRPIGVSRADGRSEGYQPFSFANEELTSVLVAEGYGEDPTFGAMCGLNVDPVAIPPGAQAMDGIFRTDFPSPPGHGSIRPVERGKLPDQLCDWAESL